MCDYSLHHVATRPAQIEDKLVTTKFNIRSLAVSRRSGSRMLRSACCPVPRSHSTRMFECEPLFGIGILPNKKIGQRLARFRQINMDNAVAHHDALEFPDGQVVLLTRLCESQRATVLQLPASARAATAEGAAVEPQLRESSLSI